MKRRAVPLGFVGLVALACLSGCEGGDGLVEGTDLRMVELRIPSVTALNEGDSIDVTVLVKNNGTESVTADFMTEVTFFDDAGLADESAWSAISAPCVGGLASGETIALVLSTIVDASEPPQLVFCRATCDSNGDVDEVDEGNNVCVKTCQVLSGTGGGPVDPGDPGDPGDPTPTEGSDPGISSVNVPDSVARGNSLDVAVTVRNFGDTTAVGSALVTVIVNEGTSLPFGDFADKWVSLAPDSTTSFDFSLEVDSEYPTGTAQIAASLEFLGDAGPDNNEATTTFQITGPPQPDLVVASVTSSDTYGGGGTGGLSVGFTLRNDGNAEAYGSMAFVLICGETEGVNDAVKIGETPVAALAAGAESSGYTVSCTYSAPVTGNYKVYVKADGLQTVAESNEGNNADKFDITFIYGVDAADLAVTILYLSPSFNFNAPGDQIDVFYEVANVGPGDAPASWVGITLTDESGGQEQSFGPYAVPEIEASDSYTAMQFVVPDSVSPVGGEPYVLTVTADLLDEIAESDEGNNTASDAVLMY
jgi:hypothetical protein